MRVTRRTLATLRDTLTIAARLVGDRDAVHLLRLKPGSLPAEAHAGDGAEGEAAVPPTPDAFRDAIDPDHVYSERDLLTLYLETYPLARSSTIDRKVARNRRLRERQDAALARIEAVLVEAPHPDHELAGWFAPFLVTRLAEAGVTTFAQLLGLIRRRRRADRCVRRPARRVVGVPLATGHDAAPAVAGWPPGPAARRARRPTWRR